MAVRGDGCMWEEFLCSPIAHTGCYFELKLVAVLDACAQWEPLPHAT